MHAEHKLDDKEIRDAFMLRCYVRMSVSRALDEMVDPPMIRELAAVKAKMLRDLFDICPCVVMCQYDSIIVMTDRMINTRYEALKAIKQSLRRSYPERIHDVW